MPDYMYELYVFTIKFKKASYKKLNSFPVVVVVGCGGL